MMNADSTITTPRISVRSRLVTESTKCRPRPGTWIVVVIANWTEEIRRWNRQLDQVLPYIEYIDSQPKVAERFRAAVRDLTDRLAKFL